MKSCIIIFPFFAFFCSCSVSHTLPAEKPLLPHQEEAKWWIINSVSKAKNDKDIHLCALVSMDFFAGKKYGGFFFTTWSEADSSFYSGFQNSGNPELQLKEHFPVSITTNDSVSGGWSWTMKRNNTNLEGVLNKRNSLTISPSSFKASLDYETQKPFILSPILVAPNAWIAKPLNASLSLETGSTSISVGKLFISTFTGKTVLFGRAKKDFVTWLDISLNTGDHLNLLFRTDSKGAVIVDAAILSDKNGNFMLKSEIEVQTKSVRIEAGGSKPYPLYYSINLPGSNINILERPRMQNQEVVNNKSSFWMGAVEVVDPNTGVQQGKGNMYIFKQ